MPIILSHQGGVASLYSTDQGDRKGMCRVFRRAHKVKREQSDRVKEELHGEATLFYPVDRQSSTRLARNPDPLNSSESFTTNSAFLFSPSRGFRSYAVSQFCERDFVIFLNFGNDKNTASRSIF